MKVLFTSVFYLASMTAVVAVPVEESNSETKMIGSQSTETFMAQCSKGKVTGGGFQFDSAPKNIDWEIRKNAPSGTNRWNLSYTIEAAPLAILM